MHVALQVSLAKQESCFYAIRTKTIAYYQCQKNRPFQLDWSVDALPEVSQAIY